MQPGYIKIINYIFYESILDQRCQFCTIRSRERKYYYFFLLIFFPFIYIFCTSDSVSGCILWMKREKRCIPDWKVNMILVKRTKNTNLSSKICLYISGEIDFDRIFHANFLTCVKPHSSTLWFLAIGGQQSSLDHVVVRPSWTLKKGGGREREQSC